MCEIHDTADKLGTDRPVFGIIPGGETIRSGNEAYDSFTEHMANAGALADMVRTAELSGPTMPVYEDGTPGRIAKMMGAELNAVSIAGAAMWDAYRASEAAVRTLDTQLREIADAQETLRKRDRLRELLTPGPSKEGLHTILKPDDTEGGAHD